ncbi:pyridoxal phosphate-dependent aminotransferase [Flavimaricola marinus]|uniref:Aminotransferase n=1 Tax=Flavimaricola marinus TaxID=1819565 RepID=A0A238LDZ2_9RHOB|nr:pyridoxal phosphate-dependent aminotransferase [Flavimaricola marinus]SMY07625.1 Arginine--pyruvate transaminase AruH [Flavimaricola marinus]
MTNMLSSRITQINAGGSDGWDLYRRARAMKEAGEPVIELTIGEHDIGTAAPILKAMYDAALAGKVGYSAIPGTDVLRRAIADRIASRTGVPTGLENVIVVPGGQAGLFAAHVAACDAGDGALYVDPYYATYPGTIRSAGLVPRSLTARAADGFQPAKADILEAAEALRASGVRPRSLLINSPNNPTGVVYSQETMAGIAEACTEADLWLISDEVYDTQVWEGEHRSPRQLPGMSERTLVVGSLSKSHAMTGSRVGWICGPAPAISALNDLVTNTTYGLPGYIQAAAVFALAQGPDFEAEVGAPFMRRRAITRELLSAQNVVREVPMQGAMYAFLDIRATGMSGSAFGEALLDATGVAVMPGESFGAAAAGHVRVAMTVADDKYRQALSKLLSFAAERA